MSIEKAFTSQKEVPSIKKLTTPSVLSIFLYTSHFSRQKLCCICFESASATRTVSYVGCSGVITITAAAIY